MIKGLLRKLLDDAPAEETEAVVVACLAQVEALPPSQRGKARAELDLVLDLRGLVGRLRRRSRELRALYETAGDLSATRDIERVLQAIVRRGRQLLNTDVAYLMMVDEVRGDTYMCVTEGTTSPGFSDIRLPLGAGLGGKVAQGTAPMWTRNYLEDATYVHVIDGVVLEEHLVAIVGVPLRTGRRVLGVLFAADRTERDFSADEVSLLASLADHAAIAIENASLFQESREAMAALSSANSTIEQANSRLERAIALHERLMKLVAAGGEVQELADALRDVMSGCVVVWDERGTEIARATSPDLGDEHLSAVLAELLSLESAAGSQRIAIGPYEAVLTPVVAAGDWLGTVVYVGDPPGDDGERALERGAGVIALLLVNHRAQAEADNRLRGEILAELLSRLPSDVAAIHRRAHLLGVDLDQSLVVLVILPESGGVPRALEAEFRTMVRDARGLVSSYADRLVALLPAAWATDPAQTVAHRLRQMHVTVGAAGPSTDLSQLIRLEDRARRAARLLVALGRAGQGISSEELGIYGLLLSEAGRDQIRSFIGESLGEVRSCDEERKTTLLATMETYFANECKVAETAEAMYVHVNTVYQRLERLDSLLGHDWRVGDRALEARLAFRLDRLMRDAD